MKKVAIVSCYFQKNYGSMLQAYATQKFLTDNKIENETICYDGISNAINNKKYQYYFKQLVNLNIVKGKLGYINIKLRKKNPFSKLGKNLRIRDAAFKNFTRKFKLSARYNSFDELTNACENYSAVLLGSDQLWLPSNLDADYYTLNWVPEKTKKISYSTSFGISELPLGYHEMAKQFLNRIQYLSTREKTGQEIIKTVSGRDAEIVCDPTMLFDGNEWMEVQEVEPLCKEPYIFCYFLGDNPEQREFVKQMKRLTGLKIVSILYLNVYAKCDRNFADIAPFDVGPAEFLNYIRNAEYVCTDSFHASVFSILYHRKFFTFRRFKENYSLATNSRLDTLLGNVGLTNRILSTKEDVAKCIDMEIDYNSVDKKVEKMRKQGRRFLMEALDAKD